MLIRLVVVQIGGLPFAIAHLLVAILLHGIVKNSVIASSCAEAKYPAIVHTASEMLWVRSLLLDFGFTIPTPIQMK